MDEFAVRTSAHEAAHAVAAYLLGWELRGIERGRDMSGETYVTPNVSVGVAKCAEDLAVVLLVPALRDILGCDRDLGQLDKLLEGGLSLSRVWTRAEQMVSSEAFKRRRRAVEARLLVQTTLDAEEIADLLGEPSGI